MEFDKYLKRMSDNGIRSLSLLFNALYWLFAAPFFLFFVLLCVPVVGNILALAFGQSVGCEFSERNADPCFVFGVDLGEVFYGYLVGMFLLGVGNPFFLIRAIFALSTTFEMWILCLSIYGVIVGRRAVRFENFRRLGMAKAVKKVQP